MWERDMVNRWSMMLNGVSLRRYSEDEWVWLVDGSRILSAICVQGIIDGGA